MAFKLSRFGTGLTILEAGGMKADCFTRPLDVSHCGAYDGMPFRTVIGQRFLTRDHTRVRNQLETG
jgi:hypothetical protein